VGERTRAENANGQQQASWADGNSPSRSLKNACDTGDRALSCTTIAINAAATSPGRIAIANAVR